MLDVGRFSIQRSGSPIGRGHGIALPSMTLALAVECTSAALTPNIREKNTGSGVPDTLSRDTRTCRQAPGDEGAPVGHAPALVWMDAGSIVRPQT